MGFDDQLWTHLVQEHGADRLERPGGSQAASSLRRGSRLRQTRTRWLLAPGFAAAVIAVLVGLAGGQHRNEAWSRTVVRRAAAIFASPANAHEIVHFQATITRTPLERSYEGLDRDVQSITEDAWFVGGRTPSERAILHPVGGDTYLALNNTHLYDITRHLEIGDPKLPTSRPLRYVVTPNRRVIRVQIPGGHPATLHASSSELDALRGGRDTVEEIIRWNGRAVSNSVIITPRQVTIQPSLTPPPNPTSTEFATELRVVLNSGSARVRRTTMADGRAALKIYLADPQNGPPITYYVDPTTYAPVELDVHNDLSRLANTVVRFHAYERLPLAGHRGLLRFIPASGERVTHAAAAFFYATGLPTLENSIG